MIVPAILYEVINMDTIARVVKDYIRSYCNVASLVEANLLKLKFVIHL